MDLEPDLQFEYVRAMAQLGAPDPANSNAIQNFGASLVRFGTQEQTSRFLPEMLSHERLWAQCFSEPEAGSDLAGLRTRAEPVADTDLLRIFGQKVWTSRAQYASWCYLLARTSPIDRDARHAGISLLIVDLHQSGVEVRPIRQITGVDEFCEVFFDGAVASRDQVIGELGDGWRISTHTLGQERSTRLAARSLQLSESVAALAGLLTDHGEAPFTSASVPEELVAGYCDSVVVEALVRRNIALADQPDRLTVSAAMGKLTWSEAAQRQASDAVRLLGPELLDSAHRRWWVDLLGSRAYSIYAGTSEIQRNIIARAAGLPSARETPGAPS
jgi:alkylation response protein AidB-like acyl-CoA dehydrogenase